ncbi:MAG: hypothetical protein EOL87_10745 [Spartobacteria bacterium]|nr:hypothetical protein [Spartobacteria bacterium]
MSDSDSTSSSRRGVLPWGIIFFWVAAISVLFVSLGVRPLWTAEERWAEIVREMFMPNGSFFHPTLNGSSYFDKPLGTYWFIAVVRGLSGVMNEWVCRLPSVLCGVMALSATMRLGTMLWNGKVGLLAGWLLLTTYGFSFWARTAQADMANLAFIMTAVWWYWKRRDQLNFVTYLVFYLLLFVGSQMKGLTALVVPLAVIAPDLLAGWRWKKNLRWCHLFAFVIGAAVYVVPFVYSNISNAPAATDSSGLALVFRENILRYVQPFDHKEPFYCYLYHVPTLLLPWSPLFLVAVISGFFTFKDRKPGETTRWLGWAILMIFLFFSISGSRRSYYILPIVPFCCLFMALFIRSDRVRLVLWKKWAVGIQGCIFLFLMSAGMLASALFFSVNGYLGHPLPMYLLIYILVPTVLAFAVFVTGWGPRSPYARWLGLPKSMAALVMIALILFMAYYGWIEPKMIVPFKTIRPFAEQMKAQQLDPDEMAFYQDPRGLPDLIFYMDSPAFHPVLNTPSEVLSFLKENPKRVLIIRKRDLDTIIAEVPACADGYAVVEEPAFNWEKPKKLRKKYVAWRLLTPEELNEL